MLGYYIIVTIILLSSSINLDVYFIEDFLNKFIFILIILLILNLSNKLYLGDSGSYTLGFIFSTFLINLYLVNNLISPYFIILLLWYPCFENLFSIIRKFRFKKSPTYPDNKHLHQLIFYFLNKKTKIKNKLVVNNLSTLSIIFYNLIIFIFALNYLRETKIQIVIILFNVLVYILLYLKLFNFRFKKK